MGLLRSTDRPRGQGVTTQPNGASFSVKASVSLGQLLIPGAHLAAAAEAAGQMLYNMVSPVRFSASRTLVLLGSAFVPHHSGRADVHAGSLLLAGGPSGPCQGGRAARAGIWGEEPLTADLQPETPARAQLCSCSVRCRAHMMDHRANWGGKDSLLFKRSVTRVESFSAQPGNHHMVSCYF